MPFNIKSKKLVLYYVFLRAKIEWTRITKEAKDANAAKTLMWPTLDIMFGIVVAPIKYPTKYPENKKPVDDRPKFSLTALTPNRVPWKPWASIINAIPIKRAQEFFIILFIKLAVFMGDLILNQDKFVTKRKIIYLEEDFNFR